MRLKVAFDDPSAGRIGLTIDYGGESLVIVASYTPSDSLLDLTNALGGLLEYDGEAMSPGMKGQMNVTCAFHEGVKSSD